MGVVDVNYQLTFRDHVFRKKRKMKDAKDLLLQGFNDMIERVKKDLNPGDIMRAAIHNDALDVPVFVPCRPMEEMNADTMLDVLMNVLNSNQDVPFDSTIQVDVGAIKYPRGGKGNKITNIRKGLLQKRSLLQIKNSDNLCLLRAVVVSFANVC